MAERKILGRFSFPPYSFLKIGLTFPPRRWSCRWRRKRSCRSCHGRRARAAPALKKRGQHLLPRPRRIPRADFVRMNFSGVGRQGISTFRSPEIEASGTVLSFGGEGLPEEAVERVVGRGGPLALGIDQADEVPTASRAAERRGERNMAERKILGRFSFPPYSFLKIGLTFPPRRWSCRWRRKRSCRSCHGRRAQPRPALKKRGQRFLPRPPDSEGRLRSNELFRCRSSRNIAPFARQEIEASGTVLSFGEGRSRNLRTRPLLHCDFISTPAGCTRRQRKRRRRQRKWQRWQFRKRQSGHGKAARRPGRRGSGPDGRRRPEYRRQTDWQSVYIKIRPTGVIAGQIPMSGRWPATAK